MLAISYYLLNKISTHTVLVVILVAAAVGLCLFQAVQFWQNVKVMGQITQLEVTEAEIILKSKEKELGRVRRSQISEVEINGDSEDRAYINFRKWIGFPVKSDLAAYLKDAQDIQQVEWPRVLKGRLYGSHSLIIPDIFEDQESLQDLLSQ